MNTKTRRTGQGAALNTHKSIAYRTLSGIVAHLVDTGRLTRTSDALTRFGGDHLPDGQQSWYGRHVVNAYRAATGADPIKVWSQHRTTGRWNHVYVYNPQDPALLAGLLTYKATRHLADQTAHTLAA